MCEAKAQKARFVKIRPSRSNNEPTKKIDPLHALSRNRTDSAAEICFPYYKVPSRTRVRCLPQLKGEQSPDSQLQYRQQNYHHIPLIAKPNMGGFGAPVGCASGG